MLIFKNLFSFGLTWGAFDFLVSGGIEKVFLIISSIQVGVCLLSIPMCTSLPSLPFFPFLPSFLPPSLIFSLLSFILPS